MVFYLKSRRGNLEGFFLFLFLFSFLASRCFFVVKWSWMLGSRPQASQKALFKVVSWYVLRSMRHLLSSLGPSLDHSPDASLFPSCEAATSVLQVSRRFIN